MNDLKKLGVVVGRIVTAEVIKNAKAADLPEAVLAELWPGRTLNKRAIKNIADLATLSKPKAKQKTENKKDGEA